MRKVPIILLLVTLIFPAPLLAQTVPDATETALADVISVRDLDLSESSVHQSGPSSFYVRSVGIGDELFSLTFTQDSSGIWTLSSLISESDNILPARTVLDFASLTATADNTLQIDGVFVDGEVYAGALSVGDDADLSLAGSIEAGSVDEVNEGRAMALAQLVVTETVAEFQAELAEQRDQLETIIDNVEAQRDGYKAERDALAVTRDELLAERDSLVEELVEVTAAAEATATRVAEGSPLTAEEVDSLLEERDQLAGDMVGLLAENNQLRSDKRTLSEQIADLQSQNDQLRTELSGMTDEITRLTALVEAYQSADSSASTAETTPVTEAVETAETEETVEVAETAEDPETVTVEEVETTESTTTEEPVEVVETADSDRESPAPAWTIPGDYLRKSDLEAVAAEVTAELKALEDRVAGLETAAANLANLEEAIRTGISDAIVADVSGSDRPGDLPGSDDPEASEAAMDPPDEAARAEGALAQADLARARAETAAAEAEAASTEAELERITSDLAELVALNEELRREAQALEDRILNDILSNGLVAMMSERLTQTVNSGFTGSDPDVGEWAVSANRAVQSDSDAFFAKLAVPANQGDGPVLYSFRVRALDPEGWVGVGLHFFVSDVELRRGYGMGRSLLVWLTRDPDVYKTQLTYLQLYRSDDDINMGRVMDSVIEEPMNRFMDVEILYEPDNQYMTVAIDGEDKVRYRTWFGIQNGIEVALRTLGAAEFTNFRIQVEPD